MSDKNGTEEEAVPPAEELREMMSEMREIYHELTTGLTDLREQRKGLTAQWDRMAGAFRSPPAYTGMTFEKFNALPIEEKEKFSAADRRKIFAEHAKRIGGRW